MLFGFIMLFGPIIPPPMGPMFDSEFCMYGGGIPGENGSMPWLLGALGGRNASCDEP